MGTALITVRSEGDLIAPPDGVILTSYDTETMGGKKSIYRAMQHSDIAGPAAVGVTFQLQHFLMHWHEQPDEETGEMVRMLRVVMIDPEGKRMSTSSAVVAANLATLCQIVGRMPPFNPPIAVKITETRSLTKHRPMKVLELAD